MEQVKPIKALVSIDGAMSRNGFHEQTWESH